MGKHDGTISKSGSDSGDGLDIDKDPIDHNSNPDECAQNGGDWVNGTTSASQIQYNASTDTFTIQSSSALYNYNTTVKARGLQSDEIGCYGNCDVTNGYSQSLKSLGQMYNTLDNYLNSRIDPIVGPILGREDAWINRHNAGLQRLACNLSPGNVMGTRDTTNTIRGVHSVNAPSKPNGNTDAGGASNIFMPNINSRKGYGPMGSAGADSVFNAAGMATQYEIDRETCLQ